MKKINVIQVARINEVYEKDSRGFIIGGKNHRYDVKPLSIATAEVDDSVDVKDIMDEIWHLCNIECWDSVYEVEGHKPIKGEKLTLNPTEHFRGYCNSDIFITDGTKVMAAEPFGWSECPNEDYAVHSIICTYEFIKWENIRNKSDFNKELIDEIRDSRKSNVVAD